MNGVAREYTRHGARYIEDDIDTVEDALRSQYWGEEGGYISAKAVYDADGATAWSEGGGGGIFEHCESNGYDWVDDDV